MGSVTPLFMQKPDDSAEFRIDEARKRGAGSPGGIFALLGELDNYRLIETLIKAPITDQQLITPYRTWLISKGIASASLVGMLLIIIRFGLLIPGESVDMRIKLSTFMVMYFLMIFGYGMMFVNYIQYPHGATWNAIRYTLYGFSSGFIFSETLKSIFWTWTIYAKTWVVKNLYGRYEYLDPVLEVYYDSFVQTYVEEIAVLSVGYLAIIYLWVHFNHLTSYLEDKQNKGRPYDLGMEQQ